MTDSTVSEEEDEDYINCWNPYREYNNYAMRGVRVRHNIMIIVNVL